MKINWKSKTIIVKVGSSTLLKGTKINSDFVKELAEEIVAVKKNGFNILIVTSGAVALGTAALNLAEKTVANLQAAASVGQSMLMHAYTSEFQKHRMLTSQFLLSRSIFKSEALSSDLKKILAKVKDTVPILNENDAIYAQGLIGFFDNDSLAANLGVVLGADLIVVLSEVDGLYTANPATDKGAKKISVVEEIKQGHMQMAGEKSGQGRGGMEAKLNAVKYATENGITTIVTSGLNKNFLSRIIKGEDLGTVFLPKKANGSN